MPEIKGKDGRWIIPDDPKDLTIMYEEEWGESFVVKISEILYVIQEYQKLRSIKLEADFSQWRGVEGRNA